MESPRGEGAGPRGGGAGRGRGAERREGQRGVRAAARGRHRAAGAVGVEGAGPGGGGWLTAAGRKMSQLPSGFPRPPRPGRRPQLTLGRAPEGATLPPAGPGLPQSTRGCAGPSARRFHLWGRGFGRRLRARLGPGAPRLIQGRRVPVRETAEALPGGPSWAVALPAGGGGMGRGVVAWRTAPNKAAGPSGMLRVPGGLRAARRNSPSRQSHTRKAGLVPWRAVCFRLFPD